MKVCGRMMDKAKIEISIPKKIFKVFDIFEHEGIEVYLVGGTVREILRGFTQGLNDFDFATPTSVEETGRILRKAGMRPIPIGKAFGTVATIIDGVRADITTFRCREEYQSGSRHPQVDFGGTIEDDLQRRDFCMNAIAMTRSGELIDPYDGAKDIQNKRISVPGDPARIFSDDPLRLLRAARFISQLGYTVVPSVKKTARKMAFLITAVSRERWKMEMDRLLMGDHVHKGLEYLLESDLLTFMMPEMTVLKGFMRPGEITVANVGEKGGSRWGLKLWITRKWEIDVAYYAGARMKFRDEIGGQPWRHQARKREMMYQVRPPRNARVPMTLKYIF